MINRDKPDRWKEDVARSVDIYNEWFFASAPAAFRESRIKSTQDVAAALKWTRNLTHIERGLLREHPEILPILRMSTCPPIARDRLIGLGNLLPNVVKCMDSKHCLPPRMKRDVLDGQIDLIIATVARLLDPDIFVWLSQGLQPTKTQVARAASIVADRLCGAYADPIVRNAQEKRQLAAIKAWLDDRGYSQASGDKAVRFREMQPGTYAFRVNVPVGHEGTKRINIPIDATIMPLNAAEGDFPVLIEAKSAGDFTNTNKRRKEEAQKMSQLRATYGQGVSLNLFLCGYFDGGYLGYEALEGIDWVWEHRIDDLAKLGL